MNIKQLVIFFGLLMMVGVLWASSHHPQKFLDNIKGKSDQHIQIYKNFCSNCHDKKPMLPLGAPIIGDEDAWKKRMSQGRATVLKHTQEGIGLMPARGGCFECSDEQLEMIVNYMINPQKKHQD